MLGNWFAPAQHGIDMTADHAPTHQPLPTIATSLNDADLIARLLSLSKKGKLAGFAPGGRGLFEAEAYGTMFDYRLVAIRTQDGLRFEVRPVWKLPIILAIVLALAAGPGLWLTHSMMVTYFSWYTLSLAWTAVWYEILTIVPIPWYVRREWIRSREAATSHAREIIPRIEAALAASIGATQS